MQCQEPWEGVLRKALCWPGTECGEESWDTHCLTLDCPRWLMGKGRVHWLWALSAIQDPVTGSKDGPGRDGTKKCGAWGTSQQGTVRSAGALAGLGREGSLWGAGVGRLGGLAGRARGPGVGSTVVSNQPVLHVPISPLQ